VEAVAEVGNPTIVATLTVVAALLPMLFVSELMGAYMAPIPANASAAMLFSFFVAVIIAPWLMLRLISRTETARASSGHHKGDALGNTLPGGRTIVELGDVVRVSHDAGSPTIFRRDGRFADMVMAGLAGAYEAPIYAMLEIADRIGGHNRGNLSKPAIRLHGQPEDQSKPTLLWDGEWEVTYVTFRDLGAAFGAAIVAIYILIVALFGSFKLPLVVLTPIPLTLIGIVLGHWLFGAPFTATSMVGVIAFAGIMVRNSILLVDFIRRGSTRAKLLRDVLLEVGAVRLKPILLTASAVTRITTFAVMIGSATILLDPAIPGFGDLAAVRPHLVDPVDRSGDPGDPYCVQG